MILPNGIIHLKYPTQRALCSAFVRVQEFYESPYLQIQQMFFTLETFRDIYAKHHGGKFTYFTDWNGFNVPSHVFKRFFIIYWNHLRPEEKDLYFKIPMKYWYSGEQFYVIGTHNDADIKHEVAHGLFFLNDRYRKEMITAIERVDKKKIKTWVKKLTKMGYGHNVIDDEIQAYFVEEELEGFERIFEKYCPSS